MKSRLPYMRRRWPHGSDARLSTAKWTADVGEFDRMVNRLLRFYRMATDAEVEGGCHWYDEASEWVFDTADVYGIAPETVATATACLSANCSWENNTAAAELLFEWGIEAIPYLHGTLPDQRAKAWQALVCPDYDIATLNPEGWKVQYFSPTILRPGSAEEAVVDTHVVRAAIDIRFSDGEASIFYGNLYRYKFISAALKEGARLVGLPVHQFQAVIWLVAKRLREKRIPHQLREHLFREDR